MLKYVNWQQQPLLVGINLEDDINNQFHYFQMISYLGGCLGGTAGGVEEDWNEGSGGAEDDDDDDGS